MRKLYWCFHHNYVSSKFLNKSKYRASVVLAHPSNDCCFYSCAIYHYMLSLLSPFGSFTLILYLDNINIATFTFILFPFSWYLLANSSYLYVMLKWLLRVFSNVTSGCVLFYKEMCCLCLFMVESNYFTFYSVTDIPSVHVHICNIHIMYNHCSLFFIFTDFWIFSFVVGLEFSQCFSQMGSKWYSCQFFPLLK